MSEDKKEAPKYKEIPLAVAIAAQQAYLDSQQKGEPQAQGKPSNLSLKPGWGGQGK